MRTSERNKASSLNVSAGSVTADVEVKRVGSWREDLEKKRGWRICAFVLCVLKLEAARGAHDDASREGIRWLRWDLAAWRAAVMAREARTNLIVGGSMLWSLCVVLMYLL